MALRYRIASRRLLAVGCLALALTTAWSTPGRADDKATAQALFDAGRKLMDEGKYAEACPKLAESQRLDPGGGTLLNLALCHENDGRTATAWGEYKEALGMARVDGRQDRIKLAEERIAIIEPKLSRVTITVAPEAEVDGLVVTLDGTELGKPVWGISTPVDPGQRAVEARAPGYVTFETTVTVGTDGDQQSVTVPALEINPVAAASPVPTAAPAPPPSAAPPPDATAESDGSTQRIIGFVVGGAGLASAVVGGIFGGLAISKNSDAEANGCNDEICNSTVGMDANDDAHTNATLSNVFIGVGAGLVAAGLIIVLTAPDGPDEEAPTTAVAPWFGPNEGGVVAQFAF